MIADATARGGAASPANETAPPSTPRPDVTVPAVRIGSTAIGVPLFKQVRGGRSLIRAAAAAFNGAEFTLAQMRAKIPVELRERVGIVLFQLTKDGELVKVKCADGRKIWRATPALRTREANLINAAPKPGSLIDNRDGSKTYVLEDSEAA